MPFVASKEQVEALQAFSHQPGFTQELLNVDFLTTSEFVKSVLRPGLEPASRPVGSVGVRLVEMSAVFEDGELPPDVEESIGYVIKAYPSSTGIGLHDDPRLVTIKITDHNTARAVGKGTLTLRGSVSDPLHEISFLSIGEFKYVSGVADYFVQEEKRLGVGDAYLPYLIGRHYDDLRTYPIAGDFDQSAKIKHEVFPARAFTSS